MKNKIRIIIIVSVIIILLIIDFMLLNKKEKIIESSIQDLNIQLDNNLEINFLDEMKISDLLKTNEYTLLNDDYIDTSKIGINSIDVLLSKDKEKYKTSFKINIVDNVSPLIWLGNSYSITRGSNDNLKEEILCADNYDDIPNCEILGDYDLNKNGNYNLQFKATDSSGNETIKDFTLYVYEPSNSNKSYTYSTIDISKIIKQYKNENTQIGIDVSEWQDEIDFEKIKDDGVEFIIIRIGSSKGTNGERFIDSEFLNNIKKANNLNMPVGIYYFSYANSKEQAIDEAKWVLNLIKDYKVELPIAYDWEDWSDYNSYHLSFYNLTEMAKGFMDTISEAGYTAMLYSSKNFLENIWMKTKYKTWLAHYVDESSYKGEYSYWQLCSNGKVNGINGGVDVNIRYLNK